MGLDNLTRGVAVAPRRILGYGVQGIGKSTFASMAPNSIFIQTEDGLNDINCTRFPLATTFQEVMKNLADLYTEKHDFKWVILDSLDWLERLIWVEVAKSKNVSHIDEIGFAKGYSFALTHFRAFLEALDALRTHRNMGVILVAHCKIEKFENPETETYDRYAPKLHKHAQAIVQEWVDEILFMSFKVHTKQSDEGFNKKKNRGVGSGERIMRTTERPAHIAKNRLGLPDEMPLDWREYAKYLPENKVSSSSSSSSKPQPAEVTNG